MHPLSGTPVKEDLFDNAASKLRYQAYARLQSTAVAFGESIPIPEIVAIGGQSDGKSSLMEALLGMATIMAKSLPEGAIADAIRDRTESHLRRLGASVCSKPIVMRAEYAYCPNLTIIDTPGFILKARQGEAESTPDDILAMVKEQCAPPSKFDNRMKEFNERWELEKYLSAAGYLPPTVKPFFVALPKDKSHTNSAEWRKAIQVVDANIKKHLRDDIDGGFDQERFAKRIGFSNLKRFLEDELASRYRDAAPATLAILQERCAAVSAECKFAEDRLRRAGDVGALRRAAIQHTLALAGRVDAVMAGFGGADPKAYGMTTEEERNQKNASWPTISVAQSGLGEHPTPQNATLKLFGGAAFERCLQEFSRVVGTFPFPTIPRDQVANMLLAQRSRGDGAGAPARAAEELARSAARQALGPVLDAVCVRLSCIIRRAYEIAAEMEAISIENSSKDDVLKPYVAFHSALRTAFNEVAVELEGKGKSLLRQHLTTATGHFSAAAVLENIGENGRGTSPRWDAVEQDDDEEEARGDNHFNSPLPGKAASEVLKENAAPAARAAGRPERSHLLTTQMTIPETPSPDITSTAKAEVSLTRRAQLAAAAAAGTAGAAGRNIDAASPGKGRVTKSARLVNGGGFRSNATTTNGLGSGYVDVCAAAEHLFSAVKESIAAQGPALKATFLEPLQAHLACNLCTELVGKTDEQFMGHFATAGALAALEADRDALRKRADGLSKMTEEFGELARAL
ncbi:putative Dynamin-related protein 5A [Nannochloris sp. 'desiccata']|nr:putative Dynamin-related protein 5A [Chlorella desiccata (nom. nud.)]